MPGLIVPENVSRIAVAVSGGADSMALAHMLATAHEDVHAITVDHGLRPESAIEAAQVGSWLAGFPNVTHTILRWAGEKPAARRMESARAARYALMADYCRSHGIGYLALAHHRDDQAETFLMRLTRGSGIDGLAAMREIQPYDENLKLWRPLLNTASHDDLKNYCRDAGMQWIEDPTNSSQKYMRNRMRAARGMLDAEGLSPKRLAATVRRIERASDALRILAARLLEKSLREKNDMQWTFDLKTLKDEPFELAVRVLRTALETLGSSGDYGPRFEKVEGVAHACLAATDSRTLTLGGCILRVNPRRGTLAVACEKARESAKSLPLAANGL